MHLALTRRLALSLLLALPAGAALAQAWPNRPVKIIVPYPPGGQTDIVWRWLGERLQAVLGLTFVVDNKAGAQGVVGLAALKPAPLELGLLATGTTPAEFVDIVKRDTPRWREIWKGAAILP